MDHMRVDFKVLDADLKDTGRFITVFFGIPHREWQVMAVPFVVPFQIEAGTILHPVLTMLERAEEIEPNE